MEKTILHESAVYVCACPHFALQRHHDRRTSGPSTNFQNLLPEPSTIQLVHLRAGCRHRRVYFCCTEMYFGAIIQLPETKISFENLAVILILNMELIISP